MMYKVKAKPHAPESHYHKGLIHVQYCLGG